MSTQIGPSVCVKLLTVTSGAGTDVDGIYMLDKVPQTEHLVYK